MPKRESFEPRNTRGYGYDTQLKSSAEIQILLGELTLLVLVCAVSLVLSQQPSEEFFDHLIGQLAKTPPVSTEDQLRSQSLELRQSTLEQKLVTQLEELGIKDAIVNFSLQGGWVRFRTAGNDLIRQAILTFRKPK